MEQARAAMHMTKNFEAPFASRRCRQK